MNAGREELLARREELARQLAEAEAALPAHSVRPQQMQRVLELEERLAEVERRLAELDRGGES